MTGKKFNKQHSLIGSAAVGLGIGMLIEVMGALFCAFFINREAMPQTSMGFLAIVVHVVSAAAGGFAAGVKNGGQIAFVCGIVGLAIAAIWTGIGILFFSGIAGGTLGNLAGILAGSVIACALQLLPKGPGLKKFSGYSR